MAFNTLPLELNSLIATFLSDDTDLCCFTLTCRDAYYAVQSNQSYVWRNRFAQVYDLVPHKNGRELKEQYILRQCYIRRGCIFGSGTSHEEWRFLAMIRGLINESFADHQNKQKWNQNARSNNLARLDIVVDTTFLLYLFHKSTYFQTRDSLFQTIQVVLTHRSLSIIDIVPTFDFPTSQQAVYGHPREFPLFLDDDRRTVNMKYILNVINFFKNHMTREQELTLFWPLKELNPDDRPRAWDKPLKQGTTELESQWLGSYSYLLDQETAPFLRRLSETELRQHVFEDILDSDNGFQSLSFDFEHTVPWPACFKTHMHSLPSDTLAHALRNDFASPKSETPRQLVSYENGIQTRSQTHYQDQAIRSLPPTPPRTPSCRGSASISPPTSRAQSQSVSSCATSDQPSPPRKGIDYLSFSGTGEDAEPFHCAGHIHALPPQNGIPGWQRISMMKIMNRLIPPLVTKAEALMGSQDTSITSSNPAKHPNPFAFYNDLSPGTTLADVGVANMAVDNAIWAYEGIVLPGGKIMVGRWWNPIDPGDAEDEEEDSGNDDDDNDDDNENAGDNENEEVEDGVHVGQRLCTGPFIFWNVPK